MTDYNARLDAIDDRLAKLESTLSRAIALVGGAKPAATSGDGTKASTTPRMLITDFIKLEYEKTIAIIERHNDQKLAYQKAYITLISIIGSVAIALLRFPSAAENLTASQNSVLSLSSLVGLLLILTGILGFALIRNLASLRHGAVHWTHKMYLVRNLIIKELEMHDYPTFSLPKADNRKSTDYISLVTCSVVNALVLVCGVSSLFFQSSVIPNVVLIVGILIGYLIVHIYFVERLLSRPIDADPSSH